MDHFIQRIAWVVEKNTVMNGLKVSVVKNCSQTTISDISFRLAELSGAHENEVPKARAMFA